MFGLGCFIFTDMLPKQEIEINPTIVSELIAEQFPTLSDLPISFLGSGWDNVNYRLGTDYIIRIPRRKIAADLLMNEMEWLPKIKQELPISISAAVYVGQADANIPWKWAITPWFDGKTANQVQLGKEEAKRLAIFLKRLHQLPTHNLPHNPMRAVPLSERADSFGERMTYLKANTAFISTKIEELWEVALSEKAAQFNSFIHGDLHPFNIIQEDGKIRAIIDWGDLTKGNEATDLAVFWMLFDNEKVRNTALATYEASQRQINIAIGWAIFYGTFFLYEGQFQRKKEFVTLGKFIIKNLNQ